MTTCTHLDTITVTQLPESVAGCEECLKAGAALLIPSITGHTRIPPSPMLSS